MFTSLNLDITVTTLFLSLTGQFPRSELNRECDSSSRNAAPPICRATTPNAATPRGRRQRGPVVTVIPRTPRAQIRSRHGYLPQPNRCRRSDLCGLRGRSVRRRTGPHQIGKWGSPAVFRFRVIF